MSWIGQSRLGQYENQYDTAQVCLNGHPVNDAAVRFPQHNRKFCPDCGAETSTQCQHCQADIKGYYYGGAIVIGEVYVPPKFCDSCGKPYPWTEQALEAARDLVDALVLSQEDKDTLVGTLNDLTKDSPHAQVSATKFKRILSKTGMGALEAFKTIMVDIASETAKKVIWG
jgi:hypothetical protein